MWGCRAASPLAAVAVCGGGRVPGRDESLPYGLNRKKDMAASCGPGMPGPNRAAVGKRDVAVSFGGVRAPRPTHGVEVGCRAASPLAAAAVGGGGKVCGRDKSLPYGLNRKKDMPVSYGPGMPGPYRTHNFQRYFRLVVQHFPQIRTKYVPTLLTRPQLCDSISATKERQRRRTV